MDEYYLMTIGRLYVQLYRAEETLNQYKKMLEEKDQKLVELKNELKTKTKGGS